MAVTWVLGTTPSSLSASALNQRASLQFLFMFQSHSVAQASLEHIAILLQSTGIRDVSCHSWLLIFSYSHTNKWMWWCTPLMPALGKQKEGRVQGYSTTQQAEGSPAKLDPAERTTFEDTVQDIYKDKNYFGHKN